jgi:hypothetical protein
MWHPPTTQGKLRVRTFTTTDNQNTLGRIRRSHKGGMNQRFVVLFFIKDIRLNYTVEEE